MNHCVRICIALLTLPFCTEAAAQAVYKCKDTAGRITYSGNECHLIGLSSAGEVTGRASVAPALKAPALMAPAARPAPSAAPDNPPAPASQDTASAPAAPEKRCFTVTSPVTTVVKTAKGTSTQTTMRTVTRCNDTPEEDAGSK